MMIALTLQDTFVYVKAKADQFYLKPYMRQRKEIVIMITSFIPITQTTEANIIGS